MSSEETRLARIKARKRARVTDVLQGYGVRLYALDGVKGSPSPHLAVNAILDRIIAAVEMEGK